MADPLWMKNQIKKIPILGKWTTSIRRRLKKVAPFTTSQEHWENRYKSGGDSGPGSYNRLAQFKADTINAFIKENDIKSVIDFGFGDGNQLRLLDIPQYVGFEVSESAVAHCQKLYDDPSKTFKHLTEYQWDRADLALSLDVLFHLVEEAVFEAHLRSLFNAAKKYVIIYASNADDKEPNPTLPQVRRRKFTPWISEHAPAFMLKAHIPNKYPFDGNAETTSRSEFFIYERI